jgi:hypothetical protein
MRGEVIEIIDEQDGRWRGTATALFLALPGDVEPGTKFDRADAYEVALELASLVATTLGG